MRGLPLGTLRRALSSPPSPEDKDEEDDDAPAMFRVKRPPPVFVVVVVVAAAPGRHFFWSESRDDTNETKENVEKEDAATHLKNEVVQSQNVLAA